MVHFIELCAGSAALSMSLEGNKSIISYAGSKWGYVQELLSLMKLNSNDVEHITVIDPGLWGIIHKGLVSKARSDVVNEINRLAEIDGRKLFDDIKPKQLLQDDTTEKCLGKRTAEALCKIAATFGGKEVGGFKGKHKHRPSVDGYIPSRHTLGKRCAELHFNKEWTVIQDCAMKISTVSSNARTVVFIDPPYKSTKGQYLNTLSRRKVVDLAERWAQVNADVYVCENEPVAELVNVGWLTKKLQKRCGQKRKDSKTTEEWVTFRTAPVESNVSLVRQSN